jgi:hypothetical protein
MVGALSFLKGLINIIIISALSARRQPQLQSQAQIQRIGIGIQQVTELLSQS